MYKVTFDRLHWNLMPFLPRSVRAGRKSPRNGDNTMGSGLSPAPLGESWQAEVLTKAPVHHLGHFLDRFDFAALQTTSATMQTSLRNVIRARSEKLPVEQRITNLGGEFCVCVAHKELLRRERRQPEDLIATGGCVRGQRVNTVMSLDLVTKRFTTLAPMITARDGHAMAVVGRKLFVMGGYNDHDLSLIHI